MVLQNKEPLKTVKTVKNSYHYKGHIMVLTVSRPYNGFQGHRSRQKNTGLSVQH